MEVQRPASPSDLPPLGELVAEQPFWRYRSATTAGAGAAHLRVWLTTGPEPGHLGIMRWPTACTGFRPRGGGGQLTKLTRFGEPNGEPSQVDDERRRATQGDDKSS